MIALIPARGGSKGIRRKNLQLVDGKPLLVHAIETCLAVTDQVWVTTDDAEMAAIQSAGLRLGISTHDKAELARALEKRVAEQVKAGDLVAHVGSTGRSTGPHLHMELRRSRKWGDTVDPVPHFQGKYAVDEPEKPQEPVSAPKPRRWVPMPNFGISGRYKADDVRAVFSFLRGRK